MRGLKDVNQYLPLYREVAQYVNRIIGRKAVTAKMLHQWVEDAKIIKRSRGTFALITHYHRLYKQMLSEEEVEQLKRSPRKTELSYRMIDVLVREGVLSPAQAKMLKQYVK